MSDLQADIDLVLQLNSPIKPIREATQRVVEAARKHANGPVRASACVFPLVDEELMVYATDERVKMRGAALNVTEAPDGQ